MGSSSKERAPLTDNAERNGQAGTMAPVPSIPKNPARASSGGDGVLTGFQHRLTRLAGEDSAQFDDMMVAVVLGKEREPWVIPLECLRSAAVPGMIAPAPGMPMWMRGVAHVRGQVWTVLDTRALIHAARGPARGGWLTLLQPPPETFWAETDPMVALWWHDIVEIAPRSRYTSETSPDHEPSTSAHWVRALWRDPDGRIWRELDLAQIWNKEGRLDRWMRRRDDLS